ncbi:hypothetical protein CFN78_04745 [Amycolatopsis antarctica]|uniref:Uncharacterized protein n=1 Tax=Amycolatopsis antarctica TaxID=1854586 RepID=A0A263D7S0_9PSEU|nr:hypothetical protein [Amycolatopsis antarctica]OZM74431.1 hypothetical protein CFN78_04745 [Amycolatopsis antarctica]
MTATAPVWALVDDAGLFPPTALPMDAALARHRNDVRRAHPLHTNRFLCPASRISELASLLGPQEPIRLGLICDTGSDGLGMALAAVMADRRLDLAVVEFPLAAADEADPVAALAAVLERTPETIPLFVEPAAMEQADIFVAALAAVGGRPAGLKVRCGGVRADLFPSVETLAHVLSVVAAARVPMKATAGLHRAVRYRDPDTGFTHHGFVNLLAGVIGAVSGADEAAVARTLREQDPDRLAGIVATAEPDVLTVARAVFTSYGSCSTSTPLAEIGALGLRAG